MEFQEILNTYGYPALAIAGAVMVVIGFIKLFTKVIPTRKSKVAQVFSYLYVAMALALSYVGCWAYLLYLKPLLGMEAAPFDLIETIKMAVAVFSLTQVIYPIYRDYGGRFILTKTARIFKSRRKKNEEVISAVEKVLLLTDKQKENLKSELNK